MSERVLAMEKKTTLFVIEKDVYMQNFQYC